MSAKIKRLNPNIRKGLNDSEIEERKRDKLVNYDTSVPTKSMKQIIRENFLTLFNILNLVLGIIVFSVGSYKNMTFLCIVILNTAISTIQEIHSKRVVDKLAIMASSEITVIRNAKEMKISIHEIVLDDILVLQTGDQIPTDCILQEGEIEVNESFLTGEPNDILKKVGDILLSGSFLVSGRAIVRVERVGEENYTAKISNGAKYVKKVNSEIMRSLNQIIKILTVVIIPVGILLFWNQFGIEENTYQDAVLKTVAGIIGMIPEGLVLLTSTVLAVSVVRLSKSKVLVQELYCIETLARVDTLCLDKTGTLTEGKMEVKKTEKKDTQYDISNVLANLAKFSTDSNSTIEAIRDHSYVFLEEWNPEKIVSFSSATKWSGIQFAEKGTFLMGAPEIVLGEKFEDYQKEIEEYAKDYRVVAVMASKREFQEKELPQERVLLGYVLITDKIREEAKDTLAYFKKQGVAVKIISGDNPLTVSRIAKQVGVEDYENYIDMSKVTTQEELEEVVLKGTVFGRVSPLQKKDMICALKKQGKTVAMTGDGVNDVLALKEADCSVAMANGSDAAKNVSQIVLLNSDFSSMPKVVEEGRRTINNIQRSASLFLVKTIYSTLNAILFLIIGEEYPFEPIQLSLIGVVTIGIPSFILALEPNRERVHGNFLRNVIAKSIPTALTVVLTIFIIAILRKYDMISVGCYSSLCIIGTGFSAICLLFTLAKARKSEQSKFPISLFRLLLACIMLALFIFGLTGLNWLFGICSLQPIIGIVIRILGITIFNFIVLHYLFQKILKVK